MVGLVAAKLARLYELRLRRPESNLQEVVYQVHGRFEVFVIWRYQQASLTGVAPTPSPNDYGICSKLSSIPFRE